MCFSALWSASDAQQTMAEIAAHMHAETKRRMECTGPQARDAIAAGPTGMLPFARARSEAMPCGLQQAGERQRSTDAGRRPEKFSGRFFHHVGVARKKQRAQIMIEKMPSSCNTMERIATFWLLIALATGQMIPSFGVTTCTNNEPYAVAIIFQMSAGARPHLCHSG